MRVITLHNAGLGSFVRQLIPMAVAGLNVLLLTVSKQRAGLMASLVEDELIFSWGDLPFERGNSGSLFRLHKRGYIQVGSLDVSGCCMEHVPVVGVYGWGDVRSEQRQDVMVIPAEGNGVESLLVLA